MARKSLSDSLSGVQRQYVKTGQVFNVPSSFPYTLISLDRLISWSKQPRTYFSQEALVQLANSIQKNGLKHPLLVRAKESQYEVIAGDRRFQGAKIAQLDSVPCIIREMTDEEALEEALSENLDRENLNSIEVLNAILQLLSSKLELSEVEVCQLLKDMRNAWEHKTDKSLGNVIQGIDEERQSLILQVFEQRGINWYSYTCNQLKLRDLPRDLYQAIASGKIEYSKGLKLKVITEQQEREKLLFEAIAQDWSHREITEKVKEWQATKVKSPKKNLTPTQRVKQLSDRIKSQNWRERPELLSQLEKKLATLEKWLDENLEQF